MTGIENECNDFEESLSIGEAFEIYVIQVLKTTWRIYHKNPDKYGIDLLWKAWNIEVKHDKKGDYTGNHYFEVSYGLAPSWVLKYPDMKYFVIWTKEKFYLLEVNELKNMLLLHWEWMYGWDFMKSFWYIVKKEEIEKIARYIYINQD